MTSKKVILAGSFGVGKTSLFNQFIFNKFDDKYLTTIGVKVNKKVVAIGERQLSILLWDIAGEVAQDKVPVTYFLGASGVIYVFDLNRPSTYKNIQQDIEYLSGILDGGVIKVVGNKKDLRNDEQTRWELQKQKQEPVRKDDGDEMSQKINAFAYLECSAKSKEGVREVFETATRAALATKKKKKKGCALL